MADPLKIFVTISVYDY